LTPLDPTETSANAAQNKIRRVVGDAKAVGIDIDTARAFTGMARDAESINGRECCWPGCSVPTLRCETDHLHDHTKDDRTKPGEPGTEMRQR
jgi:hypothetical protein